jgi:hypothetical protein
MKIRVWTLSTLLLLSLGAGQAADVYRVAGVIVNAQTGAPLAGARLAVLPEGTTRELAKQVTGADGRFAFEVPKGKYQLFGGVRDNLQRYGMRAPDALVASSVITGPDSDTGNLVFRWFPAGAISGRVTDENGDAVEAAIVQLVRSSVVAGRWITSTFAWAHTNDLGEFRFGRLGGGTYYLAVTGAPWHSTRARYGDPDEKQSDAYLPVYYPGTNDVRGAAPLVLKPGEEARADLAVRAAPAVSVTVSCEPAALMNGRAALIREGIGGTDGYQLDEWMAGGQQRLSGVPPGRYLLRVTGTNNGEALSGQQYIEVGASNVEAKMVLRPRPRVAGTVQFQHAGMKPKGSVLVSLAAEERPGGDSAAVRADGSFSFEPLAAEKFRAAVRGTDGYFASEIRVEGADFRDGVLDMVDGAVVTLRIVASDETGRVQGFVRDGDRPVEGAAVVLAPVSLPKDWMAYRGFQTDSDGSFDWPNVTAGDYLLFATFEQGLEYTKPAALRAYVAGAERVKVEAHGNVVRNIGVSSGAR